MADCVEVETLECTARGAGGFGSTGVAAEAAVEPAEGTPAKRAKMMVTATLQKVGNENTGSNQEVVQMRRELAALRAELAIFGKQSPALTSRNKFDNNVNFAPPTYD